MVGTGLLIDQEDRLRDMGLMNCGGAGVLGCWGAEGLGDLDLTFLLLVWHEPRRRIVNHVYQLA